jgi:hypothetical protein
LKLSSLIFFKKLLLLLLLLLPPKRGFSGVLVDIEDVDSEHTSSTLAPLSSSAREEEEGFTSDDKPSHIRSLSSDGMCYPGPSRIQAQDAAPDWDTHKKS